MSATATRPAQAAPELRQLGIAVGALILAVALVVALAVTQRVATQSSSEAGFAPTTFDRGWSTDANAQAPAMSVPEMAAARNEFRLGLGNSQPIGISGSVTDRGIVVGGLLYNGIPYAAPDQGTGGSNGTRFAQ
jgi:hypothetical protein